MRCAENVYCWPILLYGPNDIGTGTRAHILWPFFYWFGGDNDRVFAFLWYLLRYEWSKITNISTLHLLPFFFLGWRRDLSRLTRLFLVPFVWFSRAFSNGEVSRTTFCLFPLVFYFRSRRRVLVMMPFFLFTRDIDPGGRGGFSLHLWPLFGVMWTPPKLRAVVRGSGGIGGGSPSNNNNVTRGQAAMPQTEGDASILVLCVAFPLVIYHAEGASVHGGPATRRFLLLYPFGFFKAIGRKVETVRLFPVVWYHRTAEGFTRAHLLLAGVWGSVDATTWFLVPVFAWTHGQVRRRLVCLLAYYSRTTERVVTGIVPLVCFWRDNPVTGTQVTAALWALLVKVGGFDLAWYLFPFPVYVRLRVASKADDGAVSMDVLGALFLFWRWEWPRERLRGLFVCFFAREWRDGVPVRTAIVPLFSRLSDPTVRGQGWSVLYPIINFSDNAVTARTDRRFLPIYWRVRGADYGFFYCVVWLSWYKIAYADGDGEAAGFDDNEGGEIIARRTRSNVRARSHSPSPPKSSSSSSSSSSSPSSGDKEASATSASSLKINGASGRDDTLPGEANTEGGRGGGDAPSSIPSFAALSRTTVDAVRRNGGNNNNPNNNNNNNTAAPAAVAKFVRVLVPFYLSFATRTVGGDGGDDDLDGDAEETYTSYFSPLYVLPPWSLWSPGKVDVFPILSWRRGVHLKVLLGLVYAWYKEPRDQAMRRHARDVLNQTGRALAVGPTSSSSPSSRTAAARSMQRLATISSAVTAFRRGVSGAMGADGGATSASASGGGATTATTAATTTITTAIARRPSASSGVEWSVVQRTYWRFLLYYRDYDGSHGLLALWRHTQNYDRFLFLWWYDWRPESWNLSIGWVWPFHHDNPDVHLALGRVFTPLDQSKHLTYLMPVFFYSPETVSAGWLLHPWFCLVRSSKRAAEGWSQFAILIVAWLTTRTPPPRSPQATTSSFTPRGMASRVTGMLGSPLSPSPPQRPYGSRLTLGWIWPGFGLVHIDTMDKRMYALLLLFADFESGVYALGWLIHPLVSLLRWDNEASVVHLFPVAWLRRDTGSFGLGWFFFYELSIVLRLPHFFHVFPLFWRTEEAIGLLLIVILVKFPGAQGWDFRLFYRLFRLAKLDDSSHFEINPLFYYANSSQKLVWMFLGGLFGSTVDKTLEESTCRTCWVVDC